MQIKGVLPHCMADSRIGVSATGTPGSVCLYLPLKDHKNAMALKLFNSLSGRIEEFTPADDNTVRFYACGPTVYDYGHIGNFRTFVAVDVLRRHLRQSGYTLHHVMNITDVDDKIIRNSAS